MSKFLISLAPSFYKYLAYKIMLLQVVLPPVETATQAVDLEIFHGQHGALAILIESQGQTNFVRMQT